MKKLCKLCMAFALAFSTFVITDQFHVETIVAKTYQAFNYVENNNGTIKIVNYSGYENNITVPEEIDGMTVTTIGYGAFAECKSIESITIPNTITTIESNAFSQSSSLQKIVLPNSAVSLGENIFKGCISLKDVTLPNTIVSLPKGMFSECHELTKIILPDSLSSISDTVFQGCSSLKEINFPSNLTKIGSSAFKGCKTLETVLLPDSLRSIGASTFSDCISLTEINLPEGLTGINQSAFQDCISLEKIVIPSSIQSLGYSVFSGCSNLVDVTLPENLVGIPESAFSACSSLEYIEIPETVVEIGANAFSACISLKDIQLPDGVSSIGAGAFSYCNSLETFNIPSKLRAIPDNFLMYSQKLRYVNVPKTITNIGATAFAYCPSLESVVLPDTIERKSIGSRVFSNSPNVVVSVPDASGAYSYVVNNGVQYKVLGLDINLNYKELSLHKGETRTLTATLKNGTIVDGRNAIWKTSNPNVIAVKDGAIEAVEAGKATITIEKNGKTDECIIEVSDVENPITGVTLNMSEASAVINSTVNLSATVVPHNTTDNDTITWTTSDPNIAIVSGTGTVVLKAPGDVVITATAANGVASSCTIHVTSPITSVSMSQRSITIEVGTKYRLGASVEPYDTTQSKELTWKSSSPQYVEVDADGYVTAMNVGSSYISATSVNGLKSECKVTVVKTQSNPIKNVALDETSLSLVEGEQHQLTATIEPYDTTDSKVLTWSSSNTAVVTVENGLVRAIGKGKATITVKTSNNLTASCVVEVKKKEVPITGIQLNVTEISGYVGDQLNVTAEITPANTTMSKAIVWSSENEQVASVDQNGKLTLTGSGSTMIKATTMNNLSAYVSVNVIRIDRDDLAALIAQAEQLDSTKFTASSYGDMVVELNLAKEVISGTDQEKIDESVQTLGNAILALQFVANPQDVEALSQLVVECQALQTEFTEEEFSSMLKIITQVNGLLNKDENDIPAVTVLALQNDLSAEQMKLTAIFADNMLKDLIASAEAVDQKLYTTSSYAVLTQALNDAKTAYATGTMEEIRNCKAALKSAVSNLKEVVQSSTLQTLKDRFVDLEKSRSDFTAQEFAKMDEVLKNISTLLKTDEKNIEENIAKDLLNQLETEAVSLDRLKAEKALRSYISSVEDFISGDMSKYDPSLLTALENEIKDAKELLETAPSKDVIKDLTAKIEKALADVKVSEQQTVNKSMLNSFIGLVKDTQQGNYNSLSWSNFQLVLEEAINVSGTADVDQAAIDNAYAALLDGYFNLQLKPNTTALQLEIELAEKALEQLSEDHSSYETLANMIDDAKATKDHADTQKEVNDAAKQLRETRILLAATIR